MKRIVIGITAHVDSGKTTLSEAMLYRSGEIRSLGRVDHKDAFLDNFELERERGITIFSKQAVFEFKETSFTLLDTPGHVDFSAETERTLRIIDYAVLVISGSEGVQSHTETIWKLLSDCNVPVFVFVNKTDIAAASREQILNELNEKLGTGFADFTDEPDFEELAMLDETVMEEFLSGELSAGAVSSAILRRRIFPCVFGSALKLTGVDRFLDILSCYTVESKSSPKFGAKVYKVSYDEQGKRMTHMKITDGTLKVRDVVNGKNVKGEPWEEKINQIRIYNGSKFSQLDEVPAGCVCAVVGLTQTYPGEGLGTETDGESPFLEPVFSYSVILPEGYDAHKALVMLKRLEEEDPTLRVAWNEQLGEIRIRLMGEIQLEVLKRIIHDRFQIDVTFGKGGIAYKETVKSPVIGIGHYEPLRHYAEVHIMLEPGKPGSGV
ncbi:MAG: TetM/TetW/TetO/TetS family tetracycline resistance ribosomal protection protein, partial [Clostridia bacterium]|nr:TetM/TetW/TetO/TetS family tetracycline resistance ribosomal protection protein [Clostridia bacterium]